MDKVPRIYKMPFGDVYPMYINKSERKGRSEAEVVEIISWLTGWDKKEIEAHTKDNTDMETFFAKAPQIHKEAIKITGKVCGVQVETIEDPMMLNIRRLDKLVDELAKGRPMEKILRK